MNRSPQTLRIRCGLAAVLLASGFAAHAADAATDARKRFEADRAACLSGQSHQPQATCLRDAENAYADARRGRLAAEHANEDYERNRLMRCEPLQGEARLACVARMQGAGSVSGSVESGGIYRELVIVEPGTPVTSPAPAGAVKAP